MHRLYRVYAIYCTESLHRGPVDTRHRWHIDVALFECATKMNCIMRYVKQTLFISLYSQDPQLKVRRWIVRIVESFEDSEFSLKDQTEVA